MPPKEPLTHWHCHLCEGNTYTVVIDPVLTGLFVHESFGHLSEADMTYENPDLMEVMSLGRQFGPIGSANF
jgi:TldD protein